MRPPALFSNGPPGCNRVSAVRHPIAGVDTGVARAEDGGMNTSGEDRRATDADERSHLPICAADLRDIGMPLCAERPDNALHQERLAEALKREWEQCAQDQTPLALLAVRINNFDSLVPQHGNEAISSLLQTVAGVVRVFSIRRRDRTFRWDDATFLALLPATALSGASHMAERIVRTVRDLHITAPSSPGAGRLSVSVGGNVTIPVPGNLTDDFVRKACAALPPAGESVGHRVLQHIPQYSGTAGSEAEKTPRPLDGNLSVLAGSRRCN